MLPVNHELFFILLKTNIYISFIRNQEIFLGSLQMLTHLLFKAAVEINKDCPNEVKQRPFIQIFL